MLPELDNKLTNSLVTSSLSFLKLSTVPRFERRSNNNISNGFFKPIIHGTVNTLHVHCGWLEVIFFWTQIHINGMKDHQNISSVTRLFDRGCKAEKLPDQQKGPVQKGCTVYKGIKYNQSLCKSTVHIIMEALYVLSPSITLRVLWHWSEGAIIKITLLFQVYECSPTCWWSWHVSTATWCCTTLYSRINKLKNKPLFEALSVTRWSTLIFVTNKLLFDILKGPY